MQPVVAPRATPLEWIRANLFNSVGNSIITIAVIAAIVRARRQAAHGAA